MNSDDRPYLLGATVPASEYVERHALTQYVWKYHAEHLTSLERRVGSYSVPILGSDQEPKIQGLWRKLNARYGRCPTSLLYRPCASVEMSSRTTCVIAC